MSVGDVRMMEGDRPGALKAYEESLKIADGLAKTGRLAPADAWVVDALEARLAAVHGQ